MKIYEEPLAYYEGWDAYLDGLNWRDNPYCDDYDNYKAWNYGLRDSYYSDSSDYDLSCTPI